VLNSSQTLLKDLGTIVKDWIVFNIDGRDAEGLRTFVRITKPTPVQQRVFELLGIALK
jgi:hypothetical protein